MTRFQKLSIVTLCSAVALVTIGAVVRATGSGMGCPDWPRCGGSWIPPLEGAALIEYSHRLTAAVVGVLVFALAVTAWAKFRRAGTIFWPSFLAFLAVVFQGGLGRFVVEHNLRSELVALHFATALTLLALLAVVTVNSIRPQGGRFTGLARVSLLTAAAVATVLMLGSVVTQARAALVFPDWPLFEGRLFPDQASGREWLQYAHRLSALLLGVVLGYLAFRASKEAKENRVLVSFAHTAFALWIFQVGAGAANIFTRLAPWAVVVHVAFGALLWVCVVLLAAWSYRAGVSREPAPEEEAKADLDSPEGRKGGLGRRVRAYVGLTKPRIIELLLITTVPAMFLASARYGGRPSPILVLATLVGGWMTAGAANAINCYYDRDIDERMERTSGRPLPRREIEPVRALAFGVLLGAAGVAWLLITVNLASAALAASAILFYVFVYTLWLKRTTPSNIVIGGAAGAFPPLVGWAAVTGTLHVEAFVLFAIIFYWTPPHFWALALRYRRDYSEAGVPMLPVVSGAGETTRRIVLYTAALIGVSILLFPIARMGVLYLAAALSLGLALFLYAVRLRRSEGPVRAMEMFRVSILYLALLFVAVAVDRLLLLPPAPQILCRAALIGGWGVFLVSQALILLRRPRLGDQEQRHARRRLRDEPKVV